MAKDTLSEMRFVIITEALFFYRFLSRFSIIVKFKAIIKISNIVASVW